MWKERQITPLYVTLPAVFSYLLTHSEIYKWMLCWGISHCRLFLLFWFHFMCVMCLNVCMHVGVFVYALVDWEAWGRLGNISQLLSFSFRVSVSVKPRTCLYTYLCSHLATGVPRLHLPRLKLQAGYHAHLAFMWVLGSEFWSSHKYFIH